MGRPTRLIEQKPSYVAGERSRDSRPCVRAAELFSGLNLTTTNDNAGHETDNGRNSDGLPGFFAHAGIAATGTGFAVFDEGCLRIGQMDLQILYALIDARTQRCHVVPCQGGCFAQNRLRVGYHDLDVGEKFFSVEYGGFSHDIPRDVNQVCRR